MPYALILIGAVLVVSGVRNTQAQLWALIQNDFVGPGGFIVWAAAIAVVGGMGYIPKLRPLSIAFMTLLLLVLVISNKGVFAQLQNFIQSGAGSAGTVGVPLNQATAGSGIPPLRGANIPSPEEQINQNLQNLGGP
ncbi:MAG: hypothetical protein KGJ13_06520 [Patescibacteria group bacterium]|nr:hypothetical protein [Patescibacteria group bacterium]